MQASLLIGTVLVVLAGLAWRWIRRYQERRQAAEAREAAFLASLAAVREGDAVGPRAARPAAASGGRPLEGAASGPGPQPRAYLKSSEAQVYRALQGALPEVSIFPRGSLRRVLGPDGLAKDIRVDFVLCDRDLVTRGVVDLENPQEARALVEFKAERLTQARIAYVRWDLGHPLSRELLRAQILEPAWVSGTARVQP